MNSFFFLIKNEVMTNYQNPRSRNVPQLTIVIAVILQINVPTILACPSSTFAPLFVFWIYVRWSTLFHVILSY